MVKETVVCKYNGMLVLKKKKNSVVCDLNEPARHHPNEISQTQKDKYIMISLIYEF